LFTMSKIQFLKAIHNLIRKKMKTNWVVYDVKDTIFESNSQPAFDKPFQTFKLFTMSKIQFLKAIHNIVQVLERDVRVVYDVKDTIFESNSQQN